MFSIHAKCQFQLGMWRIPNPNPTASGTFWNPKSNGYLKSDHNGFTDLEIVFQSNLFTVYTIIFVNNK